ncbi:MAG: hypothetical protein N3D09_04960 [Archaeoglobaceae archaeon]|nr:hypothetical protein [Archaeoglobaceae archaeon]
MERLFIELSGIIDEIETAFGELEMSFSRILSEWIKAKVSRELERDVNESELIMAFLVLVAARNMAEIEDIFYSDFKDLFEKIKKIDVFRF